MIVWLASYPRSGNSLCREILWQAFGIPTWSVYNDPEIAARNGMADCLGHRMLYFQDAIEFARDDEAQFVKTHELCDKPHDDFPAIYIVRDGRDALVSRAHFTLDFGGNTFGYKDFGGILRELCQPHEGMPSWNEHVLYWLTQRQGEISLVRYEDLLSRPIETLQGALRELYLPHSPVCGTLLTFDELHARWPKFFRRGRVGAWRDEMPKDVHSTFWRNNFEAMELLGYGKPKRNRANRRGVVFIRPRIIAREREGWRK